MRVLVTGGAGFIGSHTVDLLVSQGLEVTVLDSLEPQVHGRVAPKAMPRFLAEHVEKKRIRFIRGDVRDRDVVAGALKGVDALLHLAAAVGIGQSMYLPRHYVDVNAVGTATVLQAIADKKGKLARMVIASSMSLYGEGLHRCPEHGERHPRMRAEADLARQLWEPRCELCGKPLAPVGTPESTPADPTSVYAVTKKTEEELFLVFGQAYRIPAVALRYFNVYGSRQSLSNPYTGAPAIFTSRLLSGRAPQLFEDGKQSRDFVHVREVARANHLALTRPEGGGQAFNVGTGRATSIAEVARLIAARLGKSLPPELTGHWRPGDIRHCIAEVSAAEKAWGFKAQVSFEEGVGELIEWSAKERPKDLTVRATRELSRRGLVR